MNKAKQIAKHAWPMLVFMLWGYLLWDAFFDVLGSAILGTFTDKPWATIANSAILIFGLAVIYDYAKDEMENG